jgi:DNA-binding winged helix-turn-helix (wHTH) protein
VDTRIAELRRVLGDDAAKPRYIETVPGQGYRFARDVEGA